MRLRLLLAAFLLTCVCSAQSGFQPGAQLNVFTLTTDPSPCNAAMIWYNSTSNQYKICPSGSTAVIGTGSGSGTVTSVSGTANQIDVATGSTTPVISLPAAIILPGTINGLTLAALTAGFSIAGGTTSKTLTVSNTLTLAGTDASTLNIGGGGTLGTGAFQPTATASSVGLGNVTNDAQTKASIVPNTTPAAGTILIGNAGGTAYATVAVSGCALTSTGVLTCATAGNVSGTVAIANGGTNATSAVAGAIPNTSSTTAATWSQTPTLGSVGGTTGAITYLGTTSGTATAGCVGATCTAFGNTGVKSAFQSYSTGVNCSSSASPAVCTSAAAGSVALPTGTNPTLQVNTSAVTANSQIMLTVDESLGTKLGVTCNTTLSTLLNPVVTARSANTSFTFTIGAIIATNPACVSYTIIN